VSVEVEGLSEALVVLFQFRGGEYEQPFKFSTHWELELDNPDNRQALKYYEYTLSFCHSLLINYLPTLLTRLELRTMGEFRYSKYMISYQKVNL
jgi:hypothetical protein